MEIIVIKVYGRQYLDEAQQEAIAWVSDMIHDRTITVYSASPAFGAKKRQNLATK
jgi:hypothetical protein